MKFSLNIILVIITFLTFKSFANSESSIVIVANTKNEMLHVTRRDIRNLFMGGALKHDLHAVILPPKNQTRVLFNTKVVGLTESRIQSYWAQMKFSGRKVQPKEVDTEINMIEYLKQHEGSVAYLPAESFIPRELTVLLTIN